ncbi:MAG: radical SAM protein [Desulfobacterales bacterium]|nr:radical SAM protein [Desulfobacterales bacterium]
MKIILINPPAREKEYNSIVVPPLGLLYIGTVLKQAGFNVKIKDAFAEGMTWENFTGYIRNERPDIIGIGGMSPVIDTVFKAVKIARLYTKYIILGGPHVSLYKQKIFTQCPEIDFGVIGEGEETILELVKALNYGYPIENIAGVITKSFQNNFRKFIDINTLPYPDRSMLPYHLYRYPLLKHQPVTTFFSSRGCPYHCTFCDKSTFGSIWRPRSCENVMGEIDIIINCYKIRSIIFYDDLFTLNKDRVIKICEEIIKKKYKFEWKCEGRVNIVDFEVLKLMKRAGCIMIAYGVESANESGLSYLNKKTNVNQIIEAFNLTHRAGIKTTGYFILGIPVETYEDELKTIELAKKIKPTYAQFSILSPYYGTKIYEDAVNNGWYREVDAKNPVDKDLKRPVILSPNWTEKKLQDILKTAYQKFYLTIPYIYRQILSIRNFTQITSYIKEFLNIIKWMKVK